jgi:urease accessory protein
MTRLTLPPRTLKYHITRWSLVLGVQLAVATSAMAHHLPPGFEDVDEFDQVAQMASGFLHPFTGLDHLLLAFAIGWMAFARGKRFAGILSLSFLGALVSGMLAGRIGLAVPMLEQGITLSVVLCGLMIACAARQWQQPAMVLGMLAGVWHGNAHGVEMPAAASAYGYGTALAAGTVVLVALGAGAAALGSWKCEPVRRWVGVALAVAGAWLWIA